MKFNKWTVALAAVGVVSLASAAKAEEKASPVMTAVAATTISGYVDTSAQWNLGTGNANLPPYRFGGAGKADGFNLNVAQVRIEKPLDEAEWAAGYRVDLWFGPDAKALGTDSQLGLLNNASDFAIRQAYVALRTPVGNGLDWKVGVFDSIVGYESVEAPSNPNYTRSYGHSIEPQTHTGVLASYRFTDMVSASVGVANTVGPSINARAHATPLTFSVPTVGAATVDAGGTQAESFKTYMGSLALTAPDSMGFLSGSTLYGGIVNGWGGVAAFGHNQSSYYVGATVATPVTGLRAGVAFDYLDLHDVNNDTWSVAGYASYQATEKLSFHARAEYIKDKPGAAGDQGVLFQDVTGDTSAKVFALSGTIQYDLWKNVLSRLEVRWDHSLGGNNLFGGDNLGLVSAGTSAPDARNAVLIAGNIIYKF